MRLNSKIILFFLLLVVLIFGVYGRTLTYDFINFDDKSYVSDNPYVQNGLTLDSIKWALTADLFYDSPRVDYWQPVTTLSRILISQFYGQNPAGYHLLNVILHVLNSILLFLVLNKITQCFYRSAFTAMLFAFHPIQVEVVAWVTSCKDLLSIFFALLSIWTYTQNRSKRDFTWPLIFFSLSCLAKPAVILLPIFIVLLDYWPLKNFRSKSGRFLWRESIMNKKIFFACSILFFVIFTFGHSRAIQKCFYEFGWARMVLYPAHFLFYVSKILFPVNLAFYKELSLNQLSTFGIIGTLLLVASFFILWAGKFKTYPYLFVGLLWFLIGILPVFSLPPTDRYVYFPIIGFLIFFSWGFFDLANHFLSKWLSASLACAIIVLCMLQSFRQTYYWQSFETLFHHAVDIDPSNYIAYNFLAVDLIHKNKMGEAKLYLEKALKTNPDFSAARDNLNYILEERFQ